MTKTLLSLFIVSAAAISLNAATASSPDNFSGNHGAAKLLNGFSQGWGYPGPLVETSPGNFAGLARLSGISGRIFTLTNQGVLTSIYVFPGSAGIFPGAIQAVNGRLYGSQGNPWANFSFDLKGNLQSYPHPSNTPNMAVQTVTGDLYGTQANFSLPQNAFIRMSLSGVMTDIHNFTSQEGVA